MPILTQDHIGGTDIPLALFAGPLDPQVAQQPVERLLVGVVLLPAGRNVASGGAPFCCLYTNPTKW
jgi:hypothetical protein